MNIATAPDHATLMDGIYRGQRHIYDFTRKYYLFGRDRLIDGLDLAEGSTVLEVACGTGRNLDRVERCWPAAALFGLDISSEMLKSAHVRLGDRAILARGDATGFDPAALFGRTAFDRVILSYSLSMIPDWRTTLLHALELLAPGGSLHIVDFGDLGGLPSPLRLALRGWLARFHVEPCTDLIETAAGMALRRRMKVRTRLGPFRYYQSVKITRRA